MSSDDDDVWHPAPFSERCLEEIAAMLAPFPPGRLLDPFAGTGGVHALAEHGWQTVGVEEVARWAALHPDTIHGDSTRLCPGLFPYGYFDAVVTSPTWGNGINQRSPHPNAGDGRRYTYPDAAGKPMSDTNTGGARFGKTDRGEYRRLHLAIWPQVVRVLRHGGLLILNCRDSPLGDDGFRYATGWHVAKLFELGMTTEGAPMSCAKTRGFGYGERRRWVGDGELLIGMVKQDVRFAR